MDCPQREFRKFKQFLDELYTRQPEAEDFQINKFEYVQQHLEELLATVSFEEAKRIQIYFQNALLFHLNNGLNNKYEFTTLILSSDAIPAGVKPLQEPQQQQTENVAIQQQLVDFCEPSQPSENTSHEPVHAFQRRDPSPVTQSTPLMQSTPLREAYQTPVEEQNVQQSNEANQNGFTAYINSEINVPAAQTNYMISGNPAEEVPFLRAFAHLESERSSRQRPRMQNTSNKVRKRQGSNRVVPRRQTKKKRKNIQFDVLCCLQFKRNTEKQALLSYESFLYFPLMPEKSKYRFEKPASSSLASGHLSSEEIANFSFILRDHAKQCQSQIQLTSERSGSTPGNRRLRFLPFTPVRGSASGLVSNKAVSSSRRLMQSQQPLLTIHERESSIHIPPPNVPINENEMQFSVDGNLTTRPLPSYDDPSALSNIVRQPPSEIFEERSLPILQSDRSLPEIGQSSLKLNEFSSSIQPLNVNAPLVPLEVLQEQAEPIELPPPETLPIENERENQRVDAEGDSNIQVAAPEIDQTNDNRINWFEVLRARNNLIEYSEAQSNPRRRRRTRRRRRSPPEIVARPLPQEIEPISDHILPNLEMNLEQVSIPQQQIVSELPENPTTPSTSACQAPQQHYGGTVDRNEAFTLFEKYSEVVKRVAGKVDYTSWEYYDASLFDKNDNFEVYTHIFKRIIQDNYVAMEGLFESRTSRLDAARGFRFILELKAMNLIEIESIGTKIVGIKIKSTN